jgi:hypothetical protein
LKKTGIVLAFSFALLIGLFVTLPAMASSPGEKRVPVDVSFKVTSNKLIENFTTQGNVSHRVYLMKWDVNLMIDGSSTPLKGSAEVDRDTDYRYVKPGVVNQVINDHLVITFPTEGGGFIGHAQSIITDWDSATRTYNIRVHILLQGSGNFEGQTLNAWQNGPGTTPLWEGYIVKP